MIEKPMDVLTMYPVRKSKKDKVAFRNDIQSYAGSLGYKCSTEKGSFDATNVVIGDPKTARYLVTAHYDTPANMPFPNFITPCNFGMYLLYQLVIVIVFLLICLVPAVIVGLVLKNPELGSEAFKICYFLLIILMLLGPENKSNSNDNTSGVVTVLEIARNLPEEYRSRVCFVLFDLEEAGMIGSSAYRKLHKKETSQQIVFNCDCVGDGDEIVMFPMKMLKKDQRMLSRLKAAETVQGSKSLRIHEKGFSFYPSDQMNFPLGIGIGAFRRNKTVGLYCDKIHTRKDTILEEENVIILSRQLMKVICDSAQ